MQSSYSGILPGSTKKCIYLCFFSTRVECHCFGEERDLCHKLSLAFFFPTRLSFFHLGSGFCLVGVLFVGVGGFALCALVSILCFVEQILFSTRSAVVETAYIMSIEGVLAV